MEKNSEELQRGVPEQENPDRDREEVPGRPAVSPENTQQQAEEGREQQAEEGRGDLSTRLRLVLRRLFRGR
jgi:hypothetical protein